MTDKVDTAILCRNFFEYKYAQLQAFYLGYKWRAVWDTNVQKQNGDKPTILYLRNGDKSLGWERGEKPCFSEKMVKRLNVSEFVEAKVMLSEEEKKWRESVVQEFHEINWHLNGHNKRIVFLVVLGVINFALVVINLVFTLFLLSKM